VARHAVLLGFPTMAINNLKRAHLAIAFAWATHALAWFLPVAHSVFPFDAVPGWFAFGTALSPILSYQDFHANPWYDSVLSAVSAVTTLMFIVGSPLAVWRGSFSAEGLCMGSDCRIYCQLPLVCYWFGQETT
jgi:hypothetical protein